MARVRASVAPDNAASLGLLDHLGFVRVGERPDGTGGRLWVLERSVADVRAVPRRRPDGARLITRCAVQSARSVSSTRVASPRRARLPGTGDAGGNPPDIPTRRNRSTRVTLPTARSTTGHDGDRRHQNHGQQGGRTHPATRRLRVDGDHGGGFGQDDRTHRRLVRRPSAAPVSTRVSPCRGVPSNGPGKRRSPGTLVPHVRADLDAPRTGRQDRRLAVRWQAGVVLPPARRHSLPLTPRRTTPDPPTPRRSDAPTTRWRPR